jgi:hypothetical protein
MWDTVFGMSRAARRGDDGAMAFELSRVPKAVATEIGPMDGMGPMAEGEAPAVTARDVMGPRVGEVPDVLREAAPVSRVVGYDGAQEARMAEGRRAISPFGGRLATTADVNPMTFDATTGQARTYTADEAMGQNRNRLTNIMNRLDLAPELRRNAREQLGMLAGERQSDLGRQTAERVALFGAQGQAAEAMAGVEGKRVTADAMRDQAEAGLAGKRVAAEAGVDRTQLTVDQRDRAEAEKTRRVVLGLDTQRDLANVRFEQNQTMEQFRQKNREALARLQDELGDQQGTFTVGGRTFQKFGTRAWDVNTGEPLFEEKGMTLNLGKGWDDPAGKKPDAAPAAPAAGSGPQMNADGRGSEKRAEPAAGGVKTGAAVGAPPGVKRGEVFRGSDGKRYVAE